MSSGGNLCFLQCGSRPSYTGWAKYGLTWWASAAFSETVDILSHSSHPVAWGCLFLLSKITQQAIP